MNRTMNITNLEEVITDSEGLYDSKCIKRNKTNMQK